MTLKIILMSIYAVYFVLLYISCRTAYHIDEEQEK